MTWSLTPGQAADGPEGRRLIEAMGGPQEAGKVALLMDSAYEADDKERYRRRYEVERLFCRIKTWRRVFTRYDKTDVMFAAFITLVLIAEALRLR